MHKAVAGLIGKRGLLAAIAVVTVASTTVLAVDHTQLEDRLSGYQYLSPEIRALQDDDSLNPGMAILALGEQIWNSVEGAAEKSCGDCHFDAEDRMWRVAARFPKYIENIPGFGAIVGLEEQINWMRVRKMEAEPYAYKGERDVGESRHTSRINRGCRPNGSRHQGNLLCALAGPRPFRRDARGASLKRQAYPTMG